MKVSAPGKLMIVGEYAVLDGSPAVVAAVDRRAIAEWRQGTSAALPPEVEAAKRLAESEVGAEAGAVDLDLSSLRAAGRKLGLGSSAAGAAAAAGAVLAAHGADPAQAEVRRKVFALAFEGHRAVAPQGSGADVAAAVFGGVVRFRKQEPLPDVLPLPWPAGLTARVVWTGIEARTSHFVAAVRQLAQRDPAGYATRLGQLTALASELIAGAENDDVETILASTRAYGAGMQALGDAADVSIVTPALGRIAALADAYGGAAKPSGAGGGDVAIALFGRAARADAFGQACEAEGMTVLSLTLGERGTALEPA